MVVHYNLLPVSGNIMFALWGKVGEKKQIKPSDKIDDSKV